MKNNKNLIPIIAVFAILILAGIWYLYSNINTKGNMYNNENNELSMQRQNNNQSDRNNTNGNNGTTEKGGGNSQRGMQQQNGDMIAESTNTQIDDQAVSAILAALDDEYKAYATYDIVIKEFGEVRPFSMIINSEQQHIDSLVNLLNRYNIEVPENQYIDNIQAPASVQDACETGVIAEIENANLYNEQLIPAVEQYQDIKSVFNGLMNASQTKHLPAFENCAN